MLKISSCIVILYGANIDADIDKISSNFSRDIRGDS